MNNKPSKGLETVECLNGLTSCVLMYSLVFGVPIGYSIDEKYAYWALSVALGSLLVKHVLFGFDYWLSIQAARDEMYPGVGPNVRLERIELVNVILGFTSTLNMVGIIILGALIPKSIWITIAVCIIQLVALAIGTIIFHTLRVREEKAGNIVRW